MFLAADKTSSVRVRCSQAWTCRRRLLLGQTSGFVSLSAFYWHRFSWALWCAEGRVFIQTLPQSSAIVWIYGFINVLLTSGSYCPQFEPLFTPHVYWIIFFKTVFQNHFSRKWDPSFRISEEQAGCCFQRITLITSALLPPFFLLLTLLRHLLKRCWMMKPPKESISLVISFNIVFFREQRL